MAITWVKPSRTRSVPTTGSGSGTDGMSPRPSAIQVRQSSRPLMATMMKQARMTSSSAVMIFSTRL